MSPPKRRPDHPNPARPAPRTATLEFDEWLRHLRTRAEFVSDDQLIDEARKALPPSLRQGLNRRWLASLLSGEVGFDQVPVVRWLALAKALGITVEELTGAAPNDGSPIAAEVDALSQLLDETWGS